MRPSRAGRPGQGAGGSTNGGKLHALIGALWGGQESNPDFKNPGGRDFEDANFDARTQTPFQKQNFAGRLLGSPDLNASYRLSQLQGDLDIKKASEMERIKNGYEVAMEGLHHSNLSEQEKQKFANQLALQEKSHMAAGALKLGFLPTDAAIKAASDTQLPMVPSMTRNAANAGIESDRAIAGEKKTLADVLESPEGSAAYGGSLFDKFASGDIENMLKEAQAKRLGVLELGPGAYATKMDALNGTGVGLFNQPHAAPVNSFDMSTGKYLTVPGTMGGPRVTVGGQFMDIVPRPAPLSAPPAGTGKLPQSAPALRPSLSPQLYAMGSGQTSWNLNGVNKVLNPSNGAISVGGHDVPPEFLTPLEGITNPDERSRILMDLMKKRYQGFGD